MVDGQVVAERDVALYTRNLRVRETDFKPNSRSRHQLLTITDHSLTMSFRSLWVRIMASLLAVNAQP